MLSARRLLNGACRTIICSRNTIPNLFAAQMSSAAAGNDDVSFEDIVRYIHKGGATLIDVRNSNELQETGHIPTANLVPLPELNDAMALTDESFRIKYGFTKPPKNDLLITYCRSGMRAASARSILQNLGYSRVKRYPGSWLEWLHRQPEVEKALENKNN